MKATTFFLPDPVEALLSETLRATLMDGRVIDVLLPHAPSTRRPRSEEESDSAYACRAWRAMLPDNDAADALEFRYAHGWTVEELAEIRGLLEKARAELIRMASTGVLSAETLRRDAERCAQLAAEWTP